MRSKAQFTMRLMRFFDLFLLAGAVAVLWDFSVAVDRGSLFAFLLLVPLQAQLHQYYGLYESHRIEGPGLIARNLLSSHMVGLGLCVLVLPLFDKNHWYFLIELSAVWLALILISRLVLLGGLRLLRSRGFDVRRVCVIGEEREAKGLEAKIRVNPSWGMKIVYVGEPLEDRQFRFRDLQGVTIGELPLETLLSQQSVDDVLIFTRPEKIAEHRANMTACKDHGVTARLVLRAEQSEPEAGESSVEDFLGSTSVAVHVGNYDAMAMAGKRMMDVLLSALSLVVLSPLLLTLAILVKLSSPGPVIFRQMRVGRGGRKFWMYKFRTMVDGAEGMLPSLAARNITEGPAFKSRDDWRVTPVGRWLRRYSLDELPQLLNVLFGQMSLVGPRPLPVKEAEKVERAYRRRFVMRPGLTCFWQVSGRSDVTFASWMRMDLDYIDHWSLWLDAKLIARTIPVVFSGKGAY